MSSFPAQAAHVRNTGLPPRRRLLALRECVLHFAPYGFRATWHHLVLHAGIPVCLEADPASLTRALDELEDARRLWLTEARAFALRRRREKAAGRRTPGREESWHVSPGWLAWCPDPERHPAEPLPVVVDRLITAYRSGESPAGRCPACGTVRPPRDCPQCGVTSWDPVGTRLPASRRTGLPWSLIWHRAIRWDTTVGAGDIAEFRAEYTPTSDDGRFGIFQLYIRDVALGDASTTALYPHLQDLRHLCGLAESPGARPARRLYLGDTFDHLSLTLEATGDDLVFAFRTYRGYGAPPPWAPPPGRRMRLAVRRSEVIDACRAAELRFQRVLERDRATPP
ncbi:hypothetical protein [Actinoplanes sp. NPDC051851]|uniref:hypothetical protein n=1 Tax=Actinoplanes sp. NPDC051851 TaxID=3154753 RepID=UPI003414A1B4